MAKYNYKGYVIVELEQTPKTVSVEGFYGTFPSVADAKKALDAKIEGE